VLTSAIKKVDVAVFDTIKAVQSGQYKGGTDTTFDVKNNGAGIGKISSTGQKYAAKVKAVEQKIASGQLSNIPNAVK
jgi:basic membrane protein A